MIWSRKGDAQVPVTVTERWQQVVRAGQVMLHPFSRAELDAVMLDLDAVPLEDRGAYLQEVLPPQPGSGGRRGGAGGMPAQPGAAAAAGAPARDHGLAVSGADAAASLELAGFVRPGPPAQPGSGLADELAGWSADPAGGPDGRRPVTLTGDLAIITRVRAQPVWVAEASISPEPTRPDPASTRWRLIARMYASFRPPVRLIERLARPDGTVPPFALLRDDRALVALLGLCGADASAHSGGARPAGPPAGAPLRETPTAEVASEFRTLTQLRVVLADGQRVLLRNLLVASAGPHAWLLEGEQWERATEVAIGDLASRMSSLLSPPGAAAPAPPAGGDR